MEWSVKCIMCSNMFSETYKPCRGTCSHVVCSHCHKYREIVNCPVCDEVDAFLKPVIDWESMNLLGEVSLLLNPDSLWKFIPMEKDITHGRCHLCQSYELLRICVDCTEEEGLIWKSQGFWVTGEDQKSLLRVKSRGMCSNCLLEGAHEGHKIEKLGQAVMLNFRTGNRKDQRTVMQQVKIGYQVFLITLEQWKKKEKPGNGYDNMLKFMKPMLRRRVERRLRRTKRLWGENEKLHEMMCWLLKELLDLVFLMEKPREDSQEIREIHTLQAKCASNTSSLTDVSRIQEKILERMAKIGSLEALVESIKAISKRMIRNEEDRVKTQTRLFMVSQCVFKNQKSSSTSRSLLMKSLISHLRVLDSIQQCNFHGFMDALVLFTISTVFLKLNCFPEFRDVKRTYLIAPIFTSCFPQIFATLYSV